MAKTREQIEAYREQLVVIPVGLASRPQWLVWRFVLKDGQDKPSKMPYYLNGNMRGWPLGRPADKKPTEAQPQVDQGHELDRAHLGTMQQALDAIKGGRFDGVGFAFLPGDGLIGIDVDHAIDAETGAIQDHCQQIMDRCASYTELSPSGTGIHVIVQGHTDTFKDDTVGVEVYCGRQFFTVTGRQFSRYDSLSTIDQATLDWLRLMVKGPAKSPPPAPPGGSLPGVPDKAASRYCLAALDSAVRIMRSCGEGGRNKTLNAETYGLARLVHTGGISEAVIRATMADAARAVGLADAEINATLDSAMRTGLVTPKYIPELEPRRRLSVVRPNPPAPDGATRERAAPPADTPADLQEPSWVGDALLPPALDASAPAAPSRGKGPSAEFDDAFWAKVDAMADRFRLIENTLTAWDEEYFAIWQIANMRVRFGSAVVKAWLARVADGRARTVKQSNLVFEPGLEVGPDQVNMFGGMPVEPLPCDDNECAPMVALLRHLCSATSSDADEVDAVMHWVLCWQALPVQQPGTKMQTACVFHGAQGTGKNLYWDMWRDLFGEYGVTVGQIEIEDKFNGWLSRKLAIIGDEVVSRQEMYHNKNRLKSVITQQTKFPIRGMQQETRWESNHANVVFSSNEGQPLALEERDRRYLVVYTPLEADVSLYEAVRDFKANDGLRKWMHYLLQYPVGDFNPHTKPLMTRAKEELIQLNWKAPERFANDWLEGFLDLPVRVCSAEQLYRAFKRWSDRTGERWPPSQPIFTKTVERWVSERVKRVGLRHEEPMLRYKQIGVVETTSSRRTVRCWIPWGYAAPNGVTEGVWAADSLATFERDLLRFCRTPGVADDQN